MWDLRNVDLNFRGKLSNKLMAASLVMCFYLRYGCHAHSHVCNKIEKGFIWIYVVLVVDILNATLLISQLLKNLYFLLVNAE